MFLESLEINGFKSFARPLKIEFNTPITAIVGPNGSGKSNIVDAVRWVLGEQSAKTLRGNRMSDVIFAGSEDHKPLKKASVKLILNNSNNILPLTANRVEIGRRVTEDGQSDYILNGNVCRLKDIEEILFDTGLGKDSYSIVGQGKIDSIINSKPDRLRELFEEAAGISKYKHRKGEAEKRLSRTNQDIQRVEDLLQELRNQLEPLAKEAKKAKKYNTLHSNLSKLEISLLLKRWDKNRSELDSVNNDKEYFENKIETKTDKLTELKDELEKNKNIFDEKKSIYEEKREQYFQYKTKSEELNNKLEIYAEKIKGFEREKEEFNRRLKELSKKQEKLKKKEKEINENILIQDREKSEIKKRLENKKVFLKDIKSKISRKKERLSKLRDDVFSDNGYNRDINSEIEKFRERINFIDKKIEESRGRKHNLNNKIDQTLKSKQQVKNKLNKIKKKRERLKKNLNDNKNNKINIQDSINCLNDKIKEKESILNQKRSRLSVLEEMEENYNGYYSGVKNLIKKKNDFEGVIGVVAELIKTEEKFEQAIQITLGSKLQNIIVKDDRTARECINYLKANKLGRATFLPLNLISPEPYNIKKLGISHITGFLGLASSFVEYSSSIKKAIEFLLGRTVIADNLDSATRLAKKSSRRIKVVTLDGQMVRPGGSMTGGSHKTGRLELLGRSRKIKRLGKEIENLENEIEKMREQRTDLKEKLVEVKNEITSSQKENHNLELQENGISGDLANIKERIKDYRQELSRVEKDLDNFQEDKNKYSKKKNNLEDKLKNRSNDYSRSKERIRVFEEQIEDLEEKEKLISEKITKLKVELATGKQKLENLETEKRETGQELINNNNKYQEIESRLDELKDNLNTMKKRKKTISNKAESSKNKYLQLGEKKDKLKRFINQKEKVINKINNRKQNSKEEITDLKDKLHKIDLKITRLQNRNENIKERLITEYEIDPVQDEVEERIEITNFKATRDKIKELKNAIKELGIVNSGAIKEYNELEERVDYLNQQKTDLLEARESIKEVIKEIESIMEDKFLDTYYQIKEEFEEIFQELFSGGKAELFLSDSDNVLETGVEISAQPPGKQLKKLSLMSGGERALTAIALVFAFLEVNPSPFYILDEIDAPLDDANVVRFSNFIKQYSKYAQFILITHRKHMMARVDSLYGVTMEESGVSKVLSLNLNEKVK